MLQVRDVGIVLAQGREASALSLPLMNSLCERLAGQGFIVARPASTPGESEAQQVAAFEKVLDACATSPYAQGIKRWILAGMSPSSGGRPSRALLSTQHHTLNTPLHWDYPQPDRCFSALRVSPSSQICPTSRPLDSSTDMLHLPLHDIDHFKPVQTCANIYIYKG